MRKILLNIFFIGLIFFIFSCSSGLNPYSTDSKELSGEWSDFKYNKAIMYTGQNEIRIDFIADSFFYYNYVWSDLLIYQDTCCLSNYSEYASGIYKLKDNRIIFKGNWTDNTYKEIKNSGCCNKGKFEYEYDYNYYSSDSLVLNLTKKYILPRTGVKSKLVLYKK